MRENLSLRVDLLSHFTDEKSEAQREETHSWSQGVMELELDPGLCSSHSSLHRSLHSLGLRFPIWKMRTAGAVARP